MLPDQSAERRAVQPGAADLRGEAGEEGRQGWETAPRARLARAQLGDQDIRKHGGGSDPPRAFHFSSS